MKKNIVLIIFALSLNFLLAKSIANFPIVELTDVEKEAYREMVRSNPDENSFFPLQTGNYWNIFNTLDFYPEVSYTRTEYRVTDEMEFNGHRVFKLEAGWTVLENQDDQTGEDNFYHIGWFTEIDDILYYCDVDSLFSVVSDNGFVVGEDFTVELGDGEGILPGNQLHIIYSDFWELEWCLEQDPDLTYEEVAYYLWAGEVLNSGFIDIFGQITEYKTIYYTAEASVDLNHVIVWARGIGMIQNYNYEGASALLDGCVINGISYGIVSNENAEVHDPEITANNYPNPFNPETTIEFYNPRAGKVTINIYNIKGQLVKSLINQNMAQGTNSVVWDGRDGNNNPIASGIYFYKLETDSKTITKKMILMK